VSITQLLRPNMLVDSFHGDAAPLAAHLESQNVEFMQFAFRWMNCLLMREISVKNTIRMWDTYLVNVFIYSPFPN
jgi:TBC1 domain family member 2